MIKILGNAEITENGNGRAAWLEARREGITASDIAAIIGLRSAYRGAAAVYWSKIAGDELPDAFNLRKGRHDEAFVAAEFAASRPKLAITDGGLYRHDDRAWQLATFDRLAADGTGGPLVPVQIKTSATRDGWGDEPHGQIPPQYLAQVMWEISVAGADYALLPVLFQPSGPLRVYRVDRNDDDIAAMIVRAEAFRARVAERRPPPVDWRPGTTDTLRRVYAETVEEVVVIPKDLGGRLRAAKLATAAAAERLSLAENEVRARLGTATAAITRDGDVIARRSVYPNRRISVSKLRAEYPEIAAECTATAGQIDKLLVKPRKETTEGNGNNGTR